MQQEKSSVFETVKVGDKSRESWMSAFDTIPMPSLSDIGKTANLPVLHDRSFSRTAIALGDTQKGAFQVLVNGVNADQLEKDPRVAQLRRMIHKGVDVLHHDPKTKTLALAAPEDGKAKNVMGLALERNEKEVTGPVLAATIISDMKERAKGLPQHLRGRMKALEQSMEKVRLARREGTIGEGQAMAAIADVSEKAFLVAEGGKSPEQRKTEAREGRVDSLFAASAHATREASRFNEGEKFKRGLVSDVMAIDQTSRVEGQRGLREGDDFVSTSKRLQRLGLVGKDDPRTKASDGAVFALMNEPEKAKDNFEKIMVDNLTPPEGNIERSIKEKREKSDLEIKRDKPPEGVAPTTYQQVGLSGKYLAEEIGRDNENAHKDKKLAADIRQQHEKAAKEKATFARAGYAETAVLNAHKAGRDPEKTRLGSVAVAVRANTGVQEVSRSLDRQPQVRAKSKTAVKAQPQR